MKSLEGLESVLDITYGKDPYLDAWLLHFLSENDIEYTINPQDNASPEQLRFIVSLADDQIYAPCSDAMFSNLLKTHMDEELKDEYGRNWRRLVSLLREHVASRSVKKRILAFAAHNYRLIRASPIIIPSRFMKRLITIFLTQSGVGDPSRDRKIAINARSAKLIATRPLQRLIQAPPASMPAAARIRDAHYELDMHELKRLLVLATMNRLWTGGGEVVSEAALKEELENPGTDFGPLRDMFEPIGPDQDRQRILYLPDAEGGALFDLLVIKALIRQGHSVVWALKDGFYFEAPSFWDWEYDTELARALHGAHFMPEPGVSKNELIAQLRANKLVVISDGSRERLNFRRTSVTFSRAWKECDLVLAKGWRNHRRLMLTEHQFTRDVICFYRDGEGNFRLEYKPKPVNITKFSESYLTAKAMEIVSAMRAAHAEGHSVMFYSAIVGSIPGQTATAISILHTFVDHLRSRLTHTFIINPAEYFEEGMDADDLMFMWEKVQRSGLIDIWRFQTAEDIEKSFELMEQNVPPFWAGKDATYSTGCTKEMHIALEEQARYPEMQIIGPAPQKFFRRGEYGVGKFCDVAVDQCP
jgi:hypothetical protein